MFSASLIPNQEGFRLRAKLRSGGTVTLTVARYTLTGMHYLVDAKNQTTVRAAQVLGWQRA